MIISNLQVGMRLLEVNGVSLLGASHQEAVNTLRTAGLNIHLVVCKGKYIILIDGYRSCVIHISFVVKCYSDMFFHFYYFYYQYVMIEIISLQDMIKEKLINWFLKVN